MTTRYSLTIFILFVAMIPQMLMGQYVIRECRPWVENDSIYITLDTENMISPRIEETILSGLPVMVDFQVKLVNETNGNSVHHAFALRIVHDIWQDRFTIAAPGMKQILNSIDSLKTLVERIERIAMFSTRQLDRNNVYTVSVRSEITAITKLQNEMIRDWISQADQTTEEHTAKDRTSGFSFSLSRLIKSLFFREQKSEYATQWITSHRFKVEP